MEDTLRDDIEEQALKLLSECKFISRTKSHDIRDRYHALIDHHISQLELITQRKSVVISSSDFNFRAQLQDLVDKFVAESNKIDYQLKVKLERANDLDVKAQFKYKRQQSVMV